MVEGCNSIPLGCAAPYQGPLLRHYHRDMLAVYKHLVPETCLDDPFNPLARFYPLGSYTPTVPRNWVRKKTHCLLLLLVLVGLVKALGSVKETVSTIQELSKRRERELVTTPLLCKESMSRVRLSGFAHPIRPYSSESLAYHWDCSWYRHKQDQVNNIGFDRLNSV